MTVRQRPRRASWMTVAAASIGIAASVGLGLTGCAVDPGLSAATSESLQNGVVSVANQAAAGDNAAALTSLDALQQQLQAAIASGDITADRAATVQAAIDLVRADLLASPAEQAPAPEATTEPTEPETEPETEPPEPDDPATETPAPETEAPDPVAPVETAPADPNAPGNNGNGNGNGNNGNGNGNGKGDKK